MESTSADFITTLHFESLLKEQFLVTDNPLFLVREIGQIFGENVVQKFILQRDQLENVN